MAFGFPAKHQEVFSWDHDEEMLFDMVERSLERLQWNLTNQKGDMIYAKTPTGSVTLGERIIIQVAQPRVAIRSECFIPTQILDFGKNKRNTEDFFDMMEAVRLEMLS
jgi:hypothetical protein